MSPEEIEKAVNEDSLPLFVIVQIEELEGHLCYLHIRQGKIHFHELENTRNRQSLLASLEHEGKGAIIGQWLIPTRSQAEINESNERNAFIVLQMSPKQSYKYLDIRKKIVCDEATNAETPHELLQTLSERGVINGQAFLSKI